MLKSISKTVNSDDSKDKDQDIKQTLISISQSKPLKFNKHRFYAEVEYENGLKIIENGTLPAEIQPVVYRILKKLETRKTKGKMCTFYLIQDEAELNVHIAISGSQPKNFKELEHRIKKDSELSRIVTLITSSADRTKIDEKNSDPKETIIRKNLFTKLLVTLTTSYRKDEGFEEIKKKFSLSPAINFGIIIDFLNKKEVITAWQSYKGIRELDDSCLIINYLVDVIFDPRKNKPNQCELIEELNGSIDLKTGKRLKFIEIIQRAAQKYTRGISDKDIDDVYNELEMLWGCLERYTNFQIAHLLTHCAEINLIEYLHRKENILKRAGNHYVFSMKIGDESHTLYPPCDICSVIIPEHFRELHEKCGTSADFSFKACLPILPIDHSKKDPFIPMYGMTCSDENKHDQMSSGVYLQRTSKENAFFLIEELKRNNAPTEVLLRWASIFNGHGDYPSEIEYTELLQHLSSEITDNEVYIKCKDIADDIMKLRINRNAREKTNKHESAEPTMQSQSKLLAQNGIFEQGKNQQTEFPALSKLTLN